MPPASQRATGSAATSRETRIQRQAGNRRVDRSRTKAAPRGSASAYCRPSRTAVPVSPAKPSSTQARSATLVAGRQTRPRPKRPSAPARARRRRKRRRSRAGGRPGRGARARARTRPGPARAARHSPAPRCSCRCPGPATTSVSGAAPAASKRAWRRSRAKTGAAGRARRRLRRRKREVIHRTCGRTTRFCAAREIPVALRRPRGNEPRVPAITGRRRGQPSRRDGRSARERTPGCRFSRSSPRSNTGSPRMAPRGSYHHGVVGRTGSWRRPDRYRFAEVRHDDAQRAFLLIHRNAREVEETAVRRLAAAGARRDRPPDRRAPGDLARPRRAAQPAACAIVRTGRGPAEQAGGEPERVVGADLHHVGVARRRGGRRAARRALRAARTARRRSPRRSGRRESRRALPSGAARTRARARAGRATRARRRRGRRRPSAPAAGARTRRRRSARSPTRAASSARSTSAAGRAGLCRPAGAWRRSASAARRSRRRSRGPRRRAARALPPLRREGVSVPRTMSAKNGAPRRPISSSTSRAACDRAGRLARAAQHQRLGVLAREQRDRGELGGADLAARLVLVGARARGGARAGPTSRRRHSTAGRGTRACSPRRGRAGSTLSQAAAGIS